MTIDFVSRTFKKAGVFIKTTRHVLRVNFSKQKPIQSWPFPVSSLQADNALTKWESSKSIPKVRWRLLTIVSVLNSSCEPRKTISLQVVTRDMASSD